MSRRKKKKDFEEDLFEEAEVEIVDEAEDEDDLKNWKPKRKEKNEDELEDQTSPFAGVDWDSLPDPKLSDLGSFKLPKRLRNKSKKSIVIRAIIYVVIVLFLYWWFHPSINPHAESFWIFLIILVLLPAWILLRGWSNTLKAGTDTKEANESKGKLVGKLSWIPIVIVLLGGLGWLWSATFFPFNAQKYKTLLITEDADFATDIQEVNYSQIPIIDRDSAAVLGNRAMGTIADYVSQFEIDPLYSQINYQDKPVRVSPLNYANVIKWITNYSTGIPAYCIVDTTTQKTDIVRLKDPIKYTPSDPLFRNIDRYVQLEYPTYIFDEKAFEIDDEGTAWWVCPVQKRTIGLFGGVTIQGIVLCNASTGECFDYAIEDCPQWVDRAYPSDLLVQQYNYSGRYINGWWNSWLGQSGVKQTTPGTDSQLGYNYIAKDDDVWLYTGVTSATADDSIIGFVLINQRTAESHFYSVSGATETSAMSSAEGQVQHLRYVSTFPLLLNISDQPTYFMALKDSAGLVKKFAMIDIQRYQNVAIGDTVSECQKSYKALLATNGIASSSSGDAGEVTGKIDTMATAVIDGNTHFYFTLEGDKGIYDCSVTVVDIVRYAPGDKITFICYKGDPLSTVTEIK